MVFFKNYFMDPAMRQNFAYAFAETHNLNLEVRHIYVVERSLTHHLYSSDFIQRTQLNAAHYTSHFGKCSGSLAGPEIRGNCSEVSFHILNFEAIHSKIVWFRQGNM